ncbi:chromosome segregation protein SMC [Terriglobus roseus]|uniref:Chromosome partition protein Smc n=1 Tax=Terriglobus roseus TaxID=392734 RepID=A0A1H4U677_9BACT|nr:chromosome segregation protein SMC [Terriglobus roseus]SEC64217.1 condensin subunit Smc [Terriglobus roseus]
MLKLKRVQILGFKSFCDRTDVQLSGSGIAAIVGPNGCGKSNISDAITWVLGEQSAKSLRGVKMEDVIFAGTRDRKPTGMAEVSLTLVDPDVYDASDAGETINMGSVTSKPAEINDWDETAERNMSAEATLAAVAEAQPGPIPPDEESEEIEVDAPIDPNAEQAAAEAGTTAPTPLVLKIRRRKFNRAPVRAGEITVTRRLFRSGESEYLLNGKICRLRDIQDIFFGTGLSGENYAIIGQERIGQLLSSKPLDRRSIIEEAAGITRFKTKKRLAELRLEAAKQNLARVDDIFDEVTRQMGSLKRQASKAERYGQMRDELRAKLRVVLRSRLSQHDADRSTSEESVNKLTTSIDEQATSLEALDADHTAGVARGYELDEEIRAAQSRINETRVELERATARIHSNNDRVNDLAARVASGTDELAQLKHQIEALSADRDGLRLFLETATADTEGARQEAQTKQREASEAQSQVNNADREAGNGRHQSMQLMQRISNVHREEAQAAESLAGLERDAQRLVGESEQAKVELEALGKQRGQVSMTFESVTDRLKRLEAEIAQLRLDLDAKRREEMETRRRGDHLRAEAATLTGRKNSLEALIRDHSYSSETVRKLFKANGIGTSVAPVGTLADFLEVDDEHGAVVDEFLKEELNYVVVKDWNSADAGIGLLKGNVDGRATFLVHSESAPAYGDGMASRSVGELRGARPLKDCIRILNGFGRSLEVVLPKLREGFIAPDSETARTLALENPEAFFLSPSGETYHNVTVTGGKARSGGPLALKSELREIQAKLEAVQADLSQSELGVAGLTKQIQEMQHAIEAKGNERRDAEREAANSGAALRQMDSEAARIEKRLADWSLHSERNRDARAQKQDLIERKQTEAAQLSVEREAIDARVNEAVLRIEDLRLQREEVQAAAAAAAAALAGLEERRRNASANFEQNERMRNTTQQRIVHLEGQIAGAAAERTRREEETIQLTEQQAELTAQREQLTAEAHRLSAEATALRATIAEKNSLLRTMRTEIEGLREQRATLQTKIARLSSEIEHLEAQSLNDLNMPAEELRADTSIEPITAEALDAADEETRTMKGKLEAMGPVNMMALEEFAEAEQRHSFLETQRKDLLDSIANTQGAIKEIDEISKIKFDDAFAIINKNFSDTFVKLFGGGQATMKLTDESNSAESGIDLVASPPGKKMQNVLLLSGGEKALTALSLLVGIFEFQPSPFCVLDEVDAPLDETNVGRFARLVHEMSKDTQFVVITHHKRTMTEADVIYGVTMQEPGVSKIVSVNLNKAEPRRVA